MTDDVTQKRCIPCEGDIAPLTQEEANTLHTQVPLWQIADDAKCITRDFGFTDFKEAMSFVNEVADLAEFEGHHPDISISWNNVHLSLATHAIGGLSENDFILAAKIDKIEIVPA